jgi:hypothetical protein
MGSYEFSYSLGQRVRIVVSGEEGEVIGLAIYSNAMPSALIRYKAADGRALDSWWCCSALEAA